MRNATYRNNIERQWTDLQGTGSDLLLQFTDMRKLLKGDIVT